MPRNRHYGTPAAIDKGAAPTAGPLRRLVGLLGAKAAAAVR